MNEGTENIKNFKEWAYPIFVHEIYFDVQFCKCFITIQSFQNCSHAELKIEYPKQSKNSEFLEAKSIIVPFSYPGVITIQEELFLSPLTNGKIEINVFSCYFGEIIQKVSTIVYMDSLFRPISKICIFNDNNDLLSKFSDLEYEIIEYKNQNLKDLEDTILFFPFYFKGSVFFGDKIYKEIFYKSQYKEVTWVQEDICYKFISYYNRDSIYTSLEDRDFRIMLNNIYEKVKEREKDFKLRSYKELKINCTYSHLNKLRITDSQKKTLKKFINLVPNIIKGSNKVGSVILKDYYWIETKVLNLQISSHNLISQFYGRLDFIYYIFKYWRNNHSKRFEDFLNQDYFPRVNTIKKMEIIQELNYSRVYFFSDLERMSLLVVMKNNQFYYKYPYVNQYKKFFRTKEYTELLQKIKFQTELSLVPDRSYLVILDTNFQLLMTRKISGWIHHSSLSNGESVFFSGKIKIKNEKLYKITSSSGHYLPQELSFLIFLDYLLLNGIQIDNVKNKIINTETIIDNMEEFVYYHRDLLIKKMKKEMGILNDGKGIYYQKLLQFYIKHKASQK